MRKGKITAVMLALALLLSSCAFIGTTPGEDGRLPEKPELSEPETTKPETAKPEATEPESTEPESTEPESTEPEAAEPEGPVFGEYYYDLENVVLYLDKFGELPDNFITKNEAKKLGWSGGSVEDYKQGAAIGGDRFGNYEGLLPEAKGRSYTECDIDTFGYGSRGSRRLVFSNDGLYFYTSDHYESFSEVRVEDGKVVR